MKNFIKCDRDGNGYITRDELEKALERNTEVQWSCWAVSGEKGVVREERGGTLGVACATPRF